jgi:hypothetical protein
MYQVTTKHDTMMRMRMSEQMQRLKQGRTEGREVSCAMAAAYIVNCETKDGSAELSRFSRDAKSQKSDEIMLLKPTLSR